MGISLRPIERLWRERFCVTRTGRIMSASSVGSAIKQVSRVQLHPDQKLVAALHRIFGLGRATSLSVAEACGVSKDLKVIALAQRQAQHKQLGCLKLLPS